MRKDHRRGWKVLREVARREGVPLSHVVKSIEEAAEEARANARKNGDMELLRMWESIPKKGEKASAVEIVEFLSGWYR